MWSKWLDRLDERFPDWAQGRFRRELPALSVSLVVHAAILAALGLMGIAAQAELKREITSSIVAPDLPAFDSTEIQDMDQADQPVVVESIGSSAPTLAALGLGRGRPAPVAEDQEQRRAVANARRRQRFPPRRPRHADGRHAQPDRLDQGDRR